MIKTNDTVESKWVMGVGEDMGDGERNTFFPGSTKGWGPNYF